METLNRISTAVRNPGEIKPFFSRYSKSFRKLIRERQVRKIPLLLEHALGTEVLIQRRAIDSEYGRIIETEIFGNQMWVFAGDRGLSRDLLIHGVREEKSTQAFVSALQELNETVDGVTALEVGANIGYYALLEADVLDAGRVFALEPEPDNFGLLEKNIETNNFSDTISAEQAAISQEDGMDELELSEQSNTHRIHNGSQTADGEVISVKSYTIDTFLQEKGINAGEINVIRMDIEGYETEVIDQLNQIFEEDQDILLFVELHYNIISNEEYGEILEMLSGAGFEPVSAIYNTPSDASWGGTELGVNSLKELEKLPNDVNCVELIAQRQKS